MVPPPTTQTSLGLMGIGTALPERDSAHPSVRSLGG